jgi:hypothetical protein
MVELFMTVVVVMLFLLCCAPGFSYATVVCERGIVRQHLRRHVEPIFGRDATFTESVCRSTPTIFSSSGTGLSAFRENRSHLRSAWHGCRMSGCGNVKARRNAFAGAATLMLLADATLAVAGLAPRAVADSSWVHFKSPSQNISCEIDYQRGAGIPDGVYCQSWTPPQSVHMDAGGMTSVCTGQSCLGNPAVGTPILAYGQSAGTGPFSCLSEVSGVTCTAGSGRGFTISNSGITPVG